MPERGPVFSADFMYGAAVSGPQVGELKGSANDWTPFMEENAERLAREAGPDQDFGHGPLPPETWRRVGPRATVRENYWPIVDPGWWDGHWKDDIDIAADHGLTAIRFSIERAQVQPAPDGPLDHTALNRYLRILDHLEKRRLTSMITLDHFVKPLWVAERGGVENPEYVESTTKYAKALIRALNGKARIFLTTNEPDIYIYKGWIEGSRPPEKKNDLRGARKAKNNLIDTHKRIFDAVRDEIDDSIQVSAAINLSSIEPRTGTVADRVGVVLANKVINGMFLPRMRDHMHFIAVNQYSHVRKKGMHPLKKLFEDIGEPRSDMGIYLHPESLYAVSVALKKFGLPIVFTEHGLADEEDRYRGWYIQEAFRHMAQAITDGADIRGYFQWTLTDGPEWEQGNWPRHGLIAVDYETQERTPRESFTVYQSEIRKAQGVTT